MNSNQRLIASLFGALSTLTACGGGGSGASFAPVAAAPVAEATEAPKPAPVTDCTVDLRGDSILHGENSTGHLEHRPADRIREWRPAYTVADNAVSGQSITWAIGTFLNTHLTARFVVLEWSTNDINAGLDFEPALHQAVEHVKASGRTPVMTGMYPYVADPTKAEVIQRISREEKTAYAGWEQATGAVQSATDGHPSQTLSDDLTRRLVAVLDAIAPECKGEQA